MRNFIDVGTMDHIILKAVYITFKSKYGTIQEQKDAENNCHNCVVCKKIMHEYFNLSVKKNFIEIRVINY